MTAPSESTRQVVHIGVGGFALLLRYLPWWHAALLAATAVAFNFFLLPHVGGRRLYRTPDRARGFPLGILLYPVSVLILILLFPTRPDIAAAAWGILAAGDGAATLVGRALGGRRLPWNREKTIAGSIALFAFGAAAGVGLALWCRPAAAPTPPLWFSIAGPIAAALAAMLVESIPVRLDDNLSVPLSAAGVLWLMSLISTEAARETSDQLLAALPAGLALNAAVAWAGHRARAVSASGAVCGAAIGTVIFVATGPGGWLLLLATFLSAAVTSRLGLRRKTLLGIAEEHGGRRGAGNALANTGVAAAAGVVAVLGASPENGLVAFAAALAAGGSDTVASEIGKAWGRQAYLVPTFRTVPPGTSGAVSLEGTAAGLVGAMALASLAVWLGLTGSAAVLPIVIAATLGAFSESLLASTLEAPGILNNDLLNFLNTAIAALAAVPLLRALA